MPKDLSPEDVKRAVAQLQQDLLADGETATLDALYTFEPRGPALLAYLRDEGEEPSGALVWRGDGWSWMDRAELPHRPSNPDTLLGVWWVRVRRLAAKMGCPTPDQPDTWAREECEGGMSAWSHARARLEGLRQEAVI